MDPADAKASGNGPLWRTLLIAVAAVPLLGLCALFLVATIFHDCGEIRAWPHWQVFLAARRFQEAAQLAGGTFPDEGAVECTTLLSPEADDSLDPWGRPFRYERIGDDGRRARVFTLGQDDAPGGEDCDEDLVCWVDLEDTHCGSDVRVPPAAWR